MGRQKLSANGFKSGISVQVSIGEFIDRLSILEIKANRIADPGKAEQIHADLARFRAAALDAGLENVDAFKARLSRINGLLWRLEDTVREMALRPDAQTRFLECSRRIFRLNRLRAEAKAGIDVSIGCNIREVKSFL